jgi:hypothetical protein
LPIALFSTTFAATARRERQNRGSMESGSALFSVTFAQCGNQKSAELRLAATEGCLFSITFAVMRQLQQFFL